MSANDSHARGSKALSRNMWPKGLPVLKNEKRMLGVIPTDLVIPREYADVLDWAAVVRNPDEKEKMYRHILVHNNMSRSLRDGQREVVVHVQGFVSKLSLHPLGDWIPSTGAGGAASAKQFISLIHCNNPEPFGAQVDALLNLVNVVVDNCNGELTNRPRIGLKGIRLERKVFTRGSLDGKVHSVLQPSDDLTGKARSMEPGWYVKEKLIVEEQQASATVRRNHAVVKREDFVDVSVVLQIQKRGPATRPRVRVDLAMRQVVLLQSRSDIFSKYERDTRKETSQPAGAADSAMAEDPVE